MSNTGPANTTFLASDHDGRGQMIRMKVDTTDRLALFCVSAVGAALAVVGGAVALGIGGAILGVGVSMMAFAVFYALLE